MLILVMRVWVSLCFCVVGNELFCFFRGCIYILGNVIYFNW